MNEVFLHIGLHKTGTKFYQHKFFTKLDKSVINYNDIILKQYISDYIKLHDKKIDINLKKTLSEKIRVLIKSRLESINSKILISAEIMSGDLFRGYPDWEKSIFMLKEIFPKAKIILSLRYQLDWLLSCYRETIHMHHYQNFLSFISNRSKSKYVSIDPFSLDWSSNISFLYKIFGENNVKILFYEDFKMNPKDQFSNLLGFLGHDYFSVDTNTIPNRGYSAFAIYLSIFRSKFLPFTTHRPIYFFGNNGIPAGTEEFSILPKEPFWGKYFLRDNEEIREIGYPDISRYSKLKRYFSWKFFIKEILDKFFYLDWDITSYKRKELDIYYKKTNKKLFKYIKNIPPKYID